MHPLEQFEFFFIVPFSLWTGVFVTTIFIPFMIYLFFFFFLQYLFYNREIEMEVLFLFLISLCRRTFTNNILLYWFPLLAFVFLFIFCNNILGLFPYFFTITSHFFITFTLSLLVFIPLCIWIIFFNQQYTYLLFVPKDVEIPLLKLFICFIEVFSFFIRPLSLSVRLFANMLAGHVLMYILSSFYVFVTQICIFGVVFFSVLFLVSSLELLVAVIQAYVFLMLSLIYLNDILGASH